MNDKEITIYNFHKPSGTWKRTVLSGCEYSFSNTRTVSGTGALVFTQLLTVIIPTDSIKSLDGSKYTDYKEFSQLDDVADYWTINNENNNDFIVCGDCPKEISNDYKVTNLKQDFVKAGVICALDDSTDKPMLKHFKVVCK